VTEPTIKRLSVIGVGLIGGSFARALKHAGAVAEVVGYSRGRDHVEEAKALGVVDRTADSAAAAVAGADLVVVATPVGAMDAVLADIAPVLGERTVVTDVGSAKGTVVAAARDRLGERFARFVPGHPIAGTERSGAAASFAELFTKRRVILTPVAETAPDAVALVHALWTAAGAEVVEMDVERHDQILAATSHLPHVLAYGLVDLLAAMDASEEVFRFSAGGFYDFTRIASSDPVMWRDICVANAEQLAAILGRYRDMLDGLIEAVERGDGARLERIFSRAKRARDTLLPPGTRNASPE
jgi:prephenate dehydrogenase